MLRLPCIAIDEKLSFASVRKLQISLSSLNIWVSPELFIHGGRFISRNITLDFFGKFLCYWIIGSDCWKLCSAMVIVSEI